MLSAKLGGASTPQGASYTAGNVGAAAVQGYQNVSSAQQSQAQTSLAGAQERATEINSDIAQTSPKAVVSKIIDAIEQGAQGNSVSGPYSAFSKITTDVLQQSGQYDITTGGIRPKLNGKLVGEIIAKAAEIGIDVPKYLIGKLTESFE